jgi:hypothetical protein
MVPQKALIRQCLPRKPGFACLALVRRGNHDSFPPEKGRICPHSCDRWFHHYFEGAHRVIFVVDSSACSVFQKVKQEFHQLAQSPQLKNCPFLIFANKQDIEVAVTPDQLAALELEVLESHRDNVEASCAVMESDWQTE